jgi:bifunctional non-homologous end joining protein LigD
MLSFPVAPMKAGLGTLPHDDEAWAYEIKWDGWRVLAHVDGGRVRLQSSAGHDLTAKYSELGGLANSVNATQAIIDGEVVVLDDNGRPSFELLQQHQRQVVFQAFDIVQMNGLDTIGLGYEQRRSLLNDVVEPGSNWTVPSHRIGGGAELLAVTAANAMEGVMAKKLGSIYVPGKRSPNWRKVKNRTTVNLIIGGFSVGSGSRASTFGSLLVGRYNDTDTDTGALNFAGGVGTGFDAAMLARLDDAMRSRVITSCPFEPKPPRDVLRDATWIRPELTAEVEIAEWTNEGLVRHASFIRLVN